MSSANNLVNPAVSYSGEVDSLLIEKFDGQVKRAYKEKLNMKSYFDVRTVNGTNIISNKYLGTTGVQALAPGADVKGQATSIDKNSLVIDTAVIARNIVGVLADVQDDIMIKGKLAEEQVDALSYLEDRMLLQQVVYSAINNTSEKRNGKARVEGHGFSIDVRVKEATMESPNAVMAAIEYAIEKQMEQDVPNERMTIAMPWKYFNILRDAERIVNATYNTSQAITVRGFVLTSYNIPVVPTNQMPNLNRDHRDIDGKVSAHHLLSNANNSNRYDVIATGADVMTGVVAVIFGTEALLAGRSIDLTGEIWFNKNNKSWYIDSYMAEGAIPDRWEQAAVVRKVADAEASADATIVTRAKRKAIPVMQVTA